MYRMKQPIMPSTPASETPELWDIFWEQNRLYEKHLENVKYADYRRAYYKKRTEQRQIAKMKVLMEKYPAEAKAFLLQSE